MKTAIVGGGAAGFFLAVNLKEMCPDMDITIFEKSKKVLAKVEVSGGGRCNCTNSFEAVSDLQQVYPRGHISLRLTARKNPAAPPPTIAVFIQFFNSSILLNENSRVNGYYVVLVGQKRVNVHLLNLCGETQQG